MNEKVLIIGASGLLGSKLMKICKEKYKVFGTYLAHEKIKKDNNLFVLDVRERNKVFKLIEKIKPNVVFDVHSLTNVDYCELHREEAWAVNVEGTKNVAEACEKNKIKIFFISSDYVFDGKKNIYYEKDELHPLNYYGKTKAIGEKVIQLLDTDHVIVRTTVLYGIGGIGKKPFTSWVIENLKIGKEIKVVKDQFNNPTFVDNLAEILLKLYEKNAFGVFHVVGKDNVSRYKFALKIAEIFNLNKKLIKPITTSELGQIAIRPKKLKLSTKKLKNFLGVVPFGINEGLKVMKRQML